MKLSKADVVNLNNLIAIAHIGGVSSIVIDNGLASGLNDKNCAFITNSNVPNFGQKMGIMRASLLKSRLDLLLTGKDDVTMDAKESERGEITQLELQAGKTKVQFRCSSSALIKAPKSINDAAVAIVTVDKDQLQLTLNAIKVMGAKVITLIIKREGAVIFEVADANNDKVTTELEAKVERVGDLDEDELESVVHYYNTDILGALFRASSDDNGISFSVGGSGTINVIVQGHPIYIFSQIDG